MKYHQNSNSNFFFLTCILVKFVVKVSKVFMIVIGQLKYGSNGILGMPWLYKVEKLSLIPERLQNDQYLL